MPTSIVNPHLAAVLIWVILAFSADAGWARPVGDGRVKYNFNPGWLVKIGDERGVEAPAFDDTEWKRVTLPHAWNEDAAFKVDITQLPTGIAWYRKHFELPIEAAGKKVFLEFEGIRQAGEIYLNGEWIGRSENGVMAFGFDITGKVKPAPQENVIAVRTDNDWKYKETATGSSFQWSDRNFHANYGGINKNVFLHVTDKLHQTLPLFSNLGTTGVYVYATEFDVPGQSAKVTAEAQVKNDDAEPKTFSYEVTITDLSGRVVQTMDGGRKTIAPGETTTVAASARVSELNFWSWGYGYLYDVTTTLKVDGEAIDSIVTRTGFRKLDFGNGVVKLNDRVIQFKGYAQRSTNEWPAVGSCVPPWLSDFSNGLMVAGNANLVRWMHVAAWKQDVESCDRVGLLQALPAGDAEKDPVGRWWTQRLELMRDVTIYYRNHPSVVMYEGGNESISEPHMSELKAIRDQYDPHGGRGAGSREMLDSKIAEWGGEMLYINKSAKHPMWATEYSRDEGLRRYWDDWTPPYHKDGDGPDHRGKPAREYNRNQDTHAIENIVRWYDYWRERPGTGTRVSSGGVNIIFSDTNTHHRGAENYRRSGEVDAMRIPKEGFFAHQVTWNGWVDVEKHGAHIIGHWNYEATVKKPVFVVSSADEVELFVNGRSLGKGERSYRFLHTWKDVQFEGGSIKAVGFDSTGAKLCETEKNTAGRPVAIRLTPRTAPDGLLADGADVALIDVEVVDAQGQRCPTALNLIKFDLQGPAEWRGGIAQGPNNYILSKELPVECGINRAIVRSLPEAGTVIVRATSDSLEPAQVVLVAKGIDVVKGLAKAIPGSGLPSSLRRGPTPAADSVTPTRTPVRIVAATAGANGEQASLAFDDNELTKWSNDGNQAGGWIELTLERPAVIHEVTLKLAGWRNKSYPLRISVDGKEVHSGDTQKSLGYITIAVEPTRGKTVRVALAGVAEEKDAFSGVVEVTGRKLEDAEAGGGPGSLGVIEAEVYEPMTQSNL